MPSATMKGSDSPLYAVMQLTELLARPDWEPSVKAKIYDALDRADTLDKQVQLLAYARKHAPQSGNPDEPQDSVEG